MINEIVSNTTPIIIAAIFAVITAIVKGVSDVTIEYIKTKKEQLITKIGADNYNNYREIAFDIYYRVEQEFKGKTNVAQDKLNAFNGYLLAKIPGLTKEQLNHFRESVVGTVNNMIEEKGILDKAPTNTSLPDSSETDKGTTETQNSNDASQAAQVANSEVAATTTSTAPATTPISSEEVINALNTLGDIGKKVTDYITSTQK